MCSRDSLVEVVVTVIMNLKSIHLPLIGAAFAIDML